MPIEHYGQSHTGTSGLFDDEDEHEVAMSRAERHELERLDSVVRRQERSDRRQQRKAQKAAQRATEGRSKLPWPASWLGKVFGGGRDISPDATPARPVACTAEHGGRVEVPQNRRAYVIVRRPPTPEPVYTQQDVDPVDSPWLAECGMVRVRSADHGGCHIVPESSIQRSK